MSSKDPIVIHEFECLFTGNHEPGNGFRHLNQGPFEKLEEFIRRNRQEEDSSLDELLALVYRRPYGDCIQARNYVGVISMEDGTTIEILPKVPLSSGRDMNVREEKRLFLDMLQTVLHIPMKSSGASRVDLEKLGIFEAFIAMFVDAVEELVKRGLRSDYLLIRENSHYLKGKLLFSENVKMNSAHEERFFVEHDEYSLDRPENRIIKSTLKLLGRVTRSASNKRALVRLMSAFAEIPESQHVDKDLSMCGLDRTTSAYEYILGWCEVFLKGKSFSTFSGNEVSIALLFPMERLFEAYVAKLLRDRMRKSSLDYHVSIQRASKHLFDDPKTGLLRPDIICEAEGQRVILDTKWKKLRSSRDISQGDLYQMYAYCKRFSAKKTILVYPWTWEMAGCGVLAYKEKAEDGASVELFMFDLSEPKKSMEELLSVIDWS